MARAKSTKNKKGSGKGKKGGNVGSVKLSFPQKVEASLKKENYSRAKNICEIECKTFGTAKAFSLKKCDKCPTVVRVFCQEMVDGVYQEEPVEEKVEEKKTTTANTPATVRNDQPYSTVLKELIKGTKNKDIAVVIAGEVPTPKSFIGKVSCIYGVIVGTSKSRGVIYKGVQELKAGKKITKSGSSGYIGKVWEAYQELKPAKPGKTTGKKGKAKPKK